jgi:hypothetical protein
LKKKKSTLFYQVLINHIIADASSRRGTLPSCLLHCTSMMCGPQWQKAPSYRSSHFISWGKTRKKYCYARLASLCLALKGLSLNQTSKIISTTCYRFPVQQPADINGSQPMKLNKKDKMVVELHRFNLQSTNYKRANI